MYFYLLCQVAFSLLNWILVYHLWPPQSSEFPILFNTFVNMFCRAERFGCMWVPFEFGFLNKLSLVFSLE